VIHKVLKVKVFFILRYSFGSLDDLYPMFRDSVVGLSSFVEKSNRRALCDPWRWNKQAVSKCRALITQWRDAVFQKEILTALPQKPKHFKKMLYSKLPICNNNETDIMKMKRLKEVNFIFCSSEPTQILDHLCTTRGPPLEKHCVRPNSLL
jgi:hypothetical protein